jgi:hypothetical protein
MSAIFTVFILAVWVILAILVHNHAARNGYSPLLWGVVTFFFGVFALVAYAIRNII